MRSYFDLTGQVAVVTGASSGIGVQMAKALAGQGADVAILARRKEKLDQVAEQIRALGVKCLPVPCDVTDTEQIKAAVSAVMAEYGKVDILVNNAGTGSVSPAEDTPDEEWERVVNLDLTSVFKVAREFGREMIPKKYGRIINIASMYGLVGSMATPTSPYHAAKGGVVNLTRALAAEWGKHGITVNSICPGFFESELTQDLMGTEEFQNFAKNAVPIGRWGKEGELDSTVIYLASSSSSYTNGMNIAVDGGYTCI
ncbi:SDR family NAD(P)-dependent oxidoreductase [Clostridium minihomine]|uniref:SDR family NAD(P)-dependent oxidoreductase n=1 Tax=Clostridium minihomine TaxID=2045012 RepID=UPI000C77D176|nr:SDR family oxidoreductase [Clostridium minihomine]